MAKSRVRNVNRDTSLGRTRTQMLAALRLVYTRKHTKINP